MRTLVMVGAFLAHVAAPAWSQGWDTRLVSLQDYLYDEAYETALARSAAPDHIAAEATVRLLRSTGYRQVHEGFNCFTCLVERSWSSPIGPHDDLFNPKLRAPICYNDHPGTPRCLSDGL